MPMYKVKSRFPILICHQDTIMELYPGQEVNIELEIDHPNLTLVEEEKPKKRGKDVP